MTGVGDALGTAVQVALLTLLLGMFAAFLWMFLLDPLRLRSTWRVALVALAAALLVAVVDVLWFRWHIGNPYVLLVMNATAALLALARTLKRVLRNDIQHEAAPQGRLGNDVRQVQ